MFFITFQEFVMILSVLPLMYLSCVAIDWAVYGRVK